MSRITLAGATVVVLMLLSATPVFGATGRMTYAEAKARIPDRSLPAFWFGDVKDLSSHFEKLRRGQATVIATTPGGRPIHLITYGNREIVRQQANFNSAIGGRDAAAYMDKTARTRPVVLFIGPVHGQETEGLTGLVNLIEIMETGKDLRGKDQENLRRLGDRCRLLIIPAGNPDGIARFEPRSLNGMSDDDLRFWGQGTWKDDTFCDWPACKRQHPMTGENVGFLGCYFNDRGVNPMHDEFFAPMGPESAAFLRIAREEGPDLIVSLHSHESDPAVLRPAYVPAEAQQDIRSLAQQCYALLKERQLPFGGLFDVRIEGGRNPESFNLTSALYHVSGADSFTFECPHGVRGNCKVTPEQILEIQLSLYETMLRHALDKKR